MPAPNNRAALVSSPLTVDIAIDRSTLARLRVAAQVRDTTTTHVAQMIVDAVAKGDLVGAVLDDGKS